MIPLYQGLSIKRMSSFRYFSFGIHFGHFSIKTTRELVTHVLPPLLQFWRCAPEEDVLVQDQLDGGEDVKGVVHHQGLSYVPEIIRTELTSGPFWHRKNSKTCCHEILWRPAVSPNTYSGTSYDSILVIVGRLTKMIHQLQFDHCHHRLTR